MKIDQIKSVCNDGDVVRCEIVGRDQFFRIKNNQLLTMAGRHPCFVLDHFVADYEIVEPEPKVLTADEAWGIELRKLETWNSEKSCFKCGFLNGRQSGRLERDIELRPFFEYIRSFRQSLESEGFKNDAENILQYINNIPPLNPEDNYLKRESERA